MSAGTTAARASTGDSGSTTATRTETRTETRTTLVRRARRINRILAETYPDARCELDFTSPLAKGEVQACTERGIAFLPWSPLGGIGQAGGTAGVEAVRSAAERHGVSPQQVALAWLLWLGPTVIPIPGSRRPETITDSLAAAELQLDDAELQAITAAVSG